MRARGRACTGYIKTVTSIDGKTRAERSCVNEGIKMYIDLPSRAADM